MKVRKKHWIDQHRRRERQEVKNALRKVKKKMASSKDYSDIKHDFYKVYRCDSW